MRICDICDADDKVRSCIFSFVKGGTVDTFIELDLCDDHFKAVSDAIKTGMANTIKASVKKRLKL